MRKRLLALLMALVMVFGLNTAYLADTDSPTKDNSTEFKEIEVVWLKNESGQNSWNVRIKCDAVTRGTTTYYPSYETILYNEKNEVVSRMYGSGFNFSNMKPAEYLIQDFSDKIEEKGAGKYYVVVEASIFNSETKADDIIGRGESEVAEYKLPETQLPAPNASVTNGVLTFDKVEGAASYNIKVTETWYSVTANEYRETSYTGYTIDNESFIKNNDCFGFVNGGQSISYDFAKEFEADQVRIEEWYKNEGWDPYVRSERDFNFYVQAKTYDINEVRSSELKKAGEYDIRFSSEQIADKLEAWTPEKIKEKPAEAKNEIASLSKDTLVELMKDTAFVEKVALIEDTLVEKGIYPAPKKESTSAFVDGTKISIVGALMNVEEGTQVTLSVADAKDVTAPTGYFNAVALDIKLFAGETSLTNLEVPVQITMPIPTGVDKENLVILHYHEEGKDPQVITPVVNADGTMTFAVTGFSTFVVANTEADGTGDTDPVGVLVAVMALSAVVAVVAMKKKSVVK